MIDGSAGGMADMGADEDRGSGPAPLYVKVKRQVAALVRSGRLGANDRLPSESELMAMLGVSRMTVNRALREMADAGLVTRIQGVGTFVAEQKPHPGLVEIIDIADEIRSRGHRHSARVIALERTNMAANVCHSLGLPFDYGLYHSVIVHFEDGAPVQLEERWVNPAMAPGYIDQDFTRTTPFQYLQAIKGFTDAEHMITAIIPDARTRGLLEIDRTEACLRVTRRTWVAGIPGTYNYLTYPSSRYVLGTRISGSGAAG